MDQKLNFDDFLSPKVPRWKGLDILLNVLLVIMLILFVLRILFVPIKVVGHSMDNTLYDGETVALWRASGSDGYRVGDIVVLERGDEENLIIKRIVAVGGDKIAFVYNQEKNTIQFYRNDWTTPVSEPYIKEDMRDIGQFAIVRVSPSKELMDDYIIEIPEDEVFVMGDNRNASSDSRRFGSFEKKDIKGKMVFVISSNPVYEMIFGS